MTKNTLANRLARAMAHAGLNQKQLEEKAGLTKGYVSRPLRGERARLDGGILKRIAVACGVELDWLIAGQGTMALETPAGAARSDAAAPAAPPTLYVVPAGPAAPTAETTTAREESVSPFERSLAEAFRRGDFELPDLDAIRVLLRNGASLLRDETDLVGAASSWLRAAAALRREGRPIAIETLAYRMATLGSERSTRALDERSEALNAEAHEELRRLGAEPPLTPVLPPRRPRQ